MESIKKSITDLTIHFNSKMMEFQTELKTAIPATSPSSNIISQFTAFRTFVLSALENLQLQVELLTRQYDELEMRSRRKILLVHGVAHDKEVTNTWVAKLLSEKLGVSDISTEAISRAHRLGKAGSDKPRAILVKFSNLAMRDKVWLAKKNLKGSGVTLSEFLTKDRHALFLKARQLFGISKCWTTNGTIMVLGSNQTRHRVRSQSDLDSIPCPDVVAQSSSIAAVVTKDTKTTPIVKDRQKRNPKK